MTPAQRLARSNRRLEIAEMAELLAAGWQHIGGDEWMHPSEAVTYPRREAIARHRNENNFDPYTGKKT